MQDRLLRMLRHTQVPIKIMAEITMRLFGKEVGMRQPLLRQSLHVAAGKKILNIVRLPLVSKNNSLHLIEQKPICITAGLYRCARTLK